MNIIKAIEYAETFKERLKPACDRIEIVGSCKRRDKNDVHDIEILLIAKNERPVPEFGKPNQVYKTKLDKILADLEYEELIRQSSDKKDGDKLKKRSIRNTGELNEFCMELYIVTPETWGIQNVIRTGPSIFSHCFVTNKSKNAFIKELGFWYHGLLPDKYIYHRGETRISEGGKTLYLPEERDVIDLLGLGWIEPSERRKLALRQKVDPR